MPRAHLTLSSVLLIAACSAPTADVPKIDVGASTVDMGADLAASDLAASDLDDPSSDRINLYGTAIRSADEAFLERFGAAAEAIAASTIPVDDSGLVGRNRTWGGLYSPRFQLGAGFSLRMTIAASDVARAQRAFQAIEVAFSDIEEDGRLPSTVPPEFGTLNAADVASGAAFFLGDACVALLALETVEEPDTIIDASRRRAVRDQISRSLQWLQTTTALLEQADGMAPNRLFHDVLAFSACATLIGDEQYLQTADEFQSLGTALFDPSGHYVEGGGWDTNYQAVALQVGLELLTSSDFEATSQLAAATTWLADRVTNDGRIDSTGNARTCGACETFGGTPKQVGPSHVVRALGFGGLLLNDDVALVATDRFIEWWASASSGETSCFERNPSDVLVPVSCE